MIYEKLFLLLLLLPITLFAGPGDTIQVQTHTDVVIKTNPAVGHTDYTAWGVFPDASKKIYKIYAYLTFECAPGLKCGEWDYLNYIRINK